MMDRTEAVERVAAAATAIDRHTAAVAVIDRLNRKQAKLEAAIGGVDDALADADVDVDTAARTLELAAAAVSEIPAEMLPSVAAEVARMIETKRLAAESVTGDTDGLLADLTEVGAVRVVTAETAAGSGRANNPGSE